MARVQFNFGINSISGKIGGGVFSRTSYGTAIRSKAINTIQNTVIQTNHRADFNVVTQRWSQLLEAQRKAWEVYSEYYSSFPNRGGTNKLSGYIVFLQVNQNRSLVGLPILDDPVYGTPPWSFSSFDFYPTNNSLYVQYFPSSLVDLAIPIVFLTPPLSPGISNAEPKAVMTNFDSHTGNLIQLFSSYSERFFTNPVLGSAVFCYLSFVDVTTGIRSSELLIKSIVIPEV